jgi:hypothetical protein
MHLVPFTVVALLVSKPVLGLSNKGFYTRSCLSEYCED